MLLICPNHTKYMYICPGVTNCPFFYSDEEDVEIEVVEAEVVEVEVVEVAPAPSQQWRKRLRQHPTGE